MFRNILVLNSGSSSLKYRLMQMGPVSKVLAGGLIERIGEVSAARVCANHREAIDDMIRGLEAGGHLGEEGVSALGHRVVHGGEAFSSAAVIDDSVVAAIRDAIPLAPLHNPPNLEGIEACRERWPDVPQVAVFDTALHQTLQPEAYRYAIPDQWYREHHVRRYGFHGTSFAHVIRRASAHFQCSRESLNLIALHLGNGASACAIRAGQSIETSMGMTPLAGLMMGTRCGDLDPGVVFHLMRECGLTPEQASVSLNRESGLKGIAGSNDMRDVLAGAAAGNAQACLAIAMYTHRLRLYVGAYMALLDRLDALVFTGGVGEHAAAIRAGVCKPLGHLGLHLDEAANAGCANGIMELQTPGSRVRILVIPSDEETEIALQTRDALWGHGD